MNIQHSVPWSRWLGWRHAVVHDVGRQATFAHRNGRVYYDAHADHLPVCHHAEYSLLVRKQKIPNLTTSLTTNIVHYTNCFTGYCCRCCNDLVEFNSNAILLIRAINSCSICLSTDKTAFIGFHDYHIHPIHTISACH